MISKNTLIFFVFAITFSLVQTVLSAPRCPKVDGKYPVYIPHKDCTKFYECSNGTPHLFDCPDGLEFNPKLNVCDWPERAGCSSNSSESDSSSSEEDSSSSSSSESQE